MANFPINTYVIDDSEAKYTVLEGGGSSSNRLQVKQGDTVTFSHTTSGDSTTIDINTFSSSTWSTSGELSLTRGQSQTRTVKPDADLGQIQLSFNPTLSGAPTKTAWLNIISGTDINPDPFSFVSLRHQRKNTVVTSSQIQVQGVDANTNISVDKGTFQKNGSGSWLTSSTVSNGDTIILKGTTSNTHGAEVITTLTIGAGFYSQGTWSVTTEPSLASGALIPSADLANLPISLQNLKDFFGPVNGRLTDYYRGGVSSLVPDITQNNAVPTVGAIKLSDFVGAHTTLYWLQRPPSEPHKIAYTNGQSATIEIYHRRGVEFYVGHGNVTDIAEYKYVLTIEESSEVANVVLTSASNTPGTFSVNNSWYKVSLTRPNNTESEHTGYVTITARHPDYPQYTITEKVPYSMQFTALQ